MAKLPKEQSNLFWNMFQNIQDDIKKDSGYDYNREVLTYIQADDRYISYLKDYLADSTFSDKQKADITAQGQAAHDKSVKTVNDPAYAFSTDIQGMTNDMYDRVEANDPLALGKIAQRPAAATVVAEVKPAASLSSPFSMAAFPKVNPLTQQILLPGETPDPFQFKPIEENIDTSRTSSIVELPLPNGKTNTTPKRSVVELDLSSDNLFPFKFTPADPVTTSEVRAHVTEPIKPTDFVPRPQAELDAIVEENRKHKEAEKPEAEKQPEIKTETQKPAAAPTTASDSQPYEVKKGDNLWNIAKKYYDLKSDEEIKIAVATIAKANEKSYGTKANHINPGQTIQLPDNPYSDAKLDWKALDQETKHNLAKGSSILIGKHFHNAVDNVAPEKPQHAVVAPARGFDING